MLCMFLRAASMLRFSKTVCIAWIVALMPAIWPAHSCTDPAALRMSSAMIDRIAFPMMRLRVVMKACLQDLGN